ncbi:NAD(P)-binding protein [Aaosphaeria arxii CBS 175.79]|uniref:NAD(P)-binding protein n=1 Tax=Aaosphaeria arxii CBS 175.79 TaxID=1450172 RepID=A0A6A5XUD7_9PLEO|nr:NAD(P)-binding protein [Aaosphaeria arxii CBS 175.79]KAF2016975.1 NAD(P)-binding protein [Aaosphaeria arxii CBS 175.79]
MASTQKKYALVTGCTPGGIGHYLALEFAAKGYHVLATVRDPSKYPSAPHPEITYLPLEVTSQQSINALKDEVTRITNNRLDILYNNAGRNYTVPATDLDIDEVRDLFEANVYSVMAMTKAFVPLLIEAKGTIVQTGSLAGILPYVWASAYSASKAALHAFSDTLRVELAPLGVRVVNVITGGVTSNIARVHRELPADSYSLPIKDDYERRLTFSQQLGMDTQTYARSCVKQVIAGDHWYGKQRTIWEGKMSWIVWGVWFFLPRAVMDMYFTAKFSLWKLKGTVGGSNKKTN